VPAGKDEVGKHYSQCLTEWILQKIGEAMFSYEIIKMKDPAMIPYWPECNFCQRPGEILIKVENRDSLYLCQECAENVKNEIAKATFKEIQKDKR